MIGLGPDASITSSSVPSPRPAVTLWGTGTPRREFLYSEDMADACVYLMGLPGAQYQSLLGSDESATGRFDPPLINIGVAIGCSPPHEPEYGEAHASQNN